MGTNIIDLTISAKELKESFDELLAQVSVGSKIFINDNNNEPFALFAKATFFDDFLELKKINSDLMRQLKSLLDANKIKLSMPNNLSESQKSLLKIKSKFPFFADCTDVELINVVENIKIMKLEPEETLFLENDLCEEIFYIVSGYIDVVKSIYDQDKSKTLATLSPNTIFGEMAYLTKHPRSASTKVSIKSPAVVIRFNIKEHLPADLQYIHTKIYYTFAKELAKKIEKKNN